MRFVELDSHRHYTSLVAYTKRDVLSYSPTNSFATESSEATNCKLCIGVLVIVL
jgi:hypothetical protein